MKLPPIRALVPIVLLAGVLGAFGYIQADQYGLFDAAPAAPQPAAPAPALPPQAGRGDALVLPPNALPPGAAPAPVQAEAPAAGEGPHADTPAGGIETARPPAPEAPALAGPVVPLPAAAPPPFLPAARPVDRTPDPEFLDYEKRVRQLQLQASLQNLETAIAASELQIEEARTKIAKTKRERKLAEEPVAAPGLPPLALPQQGGVVRPGMAPAVPFQQGPGEAPGPAIAVLAIRQAPDGTTGATIFFDGQRYEVRAGSALHDGWSVAAIETAGVRVERTRMERGGTRPRTETRTGTFGTATSQPSVVSAPLPPLPLVPGQAMVPGPIPGSLVPATPVAESAQ